MCLSMISPVAKLDVIPTCCSDGPSRNNDNTDYVTRNDSAHNHICSNNRSRWGDNTMCYNLLNSVCYVVCSFCVKMKQSCIWSVSIVIASYMCSCCLGAGVEWRIRWWRNQSDEVAAWDYLSGRRGRWHIYRNMEERSKSKWQFLTPVTLQVKN